MSRGCRAYEARARPRKVRTLRRSGRVEAEDGRFVQIRIELLDGEDPAAISDVISVLMRTEARFATLCQHAIQVAGTHGIASVLGRHLRNAQTLVSRINGLRPKVEA